MKQLQKISGRFFLAILAMGILSLFSGCKKDFLDTARQGGYDAENYPYPGGSGPYDQFIFSAYNDLRSFNVHSQSFIAATSIRSDDADKGSTPADGGVAFLFNNGFRNVL